MCVCVCVRACGGVYVWRGGERGGVHTRKRLCVRRCCVSVCQFRFASYDLVCVVLSKYV